MYTMRIFFYLVFLFFVPMKVLAHQQRPNFVLYFPDTIRAESVGTYGSFANMTNVTPEIDAFSRDAVTFEQCHVRRLYHSSSQHFVKTLDDDE
mgnify:CR=1 FL=1